MATGLEKDITRVSTTKFDDREVIVTLTEDQSVSLKLKGLKKGEVSISIQDLYKQLSGSQESVDKTSSKKTGKENINLHDLRSKIVINSELDYRAKTIFEKIILDILKH